MAGGQISPSPIDFHRRPYNTLALPCERVMGREVRAPVDLVCGAPMVPPPISFDSYAGELAHHTLAR